MPKIPSLEPRETSRRTRKWLVNVPANISETGRRQRLFFATKDEASTYCQQTKTQVKNYGTKATVLTPGQLEQAAQAFEKLADYKVSLNEVVENWIARQRQSKASVPFEKLIEDFANAGRGQRARSASYKRSILQLLNRLEVLHGRIASDIQSTEIERAVRGMTPSVRNYTLRIISCAYNLGIARGFVSENPTKRVDQIETPSSEIAVYRPAEVAAIMSTAEVHRPELIPFFAFGFFAGIRRSELLRLDWSHVEFDESYVRLPKNITKTGQGRHIPIEPNLAKWIAPFAKRTGSILPCSEETLRRGERGLRKVHGIPAIKHGPRHCYGTYWLAAYENIDRLMLSMGHTDFETTQTHYAKAATRRDAQKFWSIEPTEIAAEKVITLTTAA